MISLCHFGPDDLKELVENIQHIKRQKESAVSIHSGISQ